MSSMVPPGWTLKQVRRYMAEESARYGSKFEDVDREGTRVKPPGILRALRNKHFMVQVYEEPRHPQVLVRLSIHRTLLDDRGEWLDGTTWDQLQVIKNEVGYAEYDALEVYPRQGDLVNVANIRHLWVMREPVAFAWGKNR